jgi:hypothetical protein
LRGCGESDRAESDYAIADFAGVNPWNGVDAFTHCTAPMLMIRLANHDRL